MKSNNGERNSNNSRQETEHEFPIKYISKTKLTVIFYFTQIQFTLILFSKNRDLQGICTNSEIQGNN